ncbi:hypothetical protein Y1Q_0024463 [Alligator mississippiensis]|uniref:Uncharacterized protein n=1 Tax=Alligator mississippiensis TaxID=8496 RepID=A0A151NAG7_ALLMI|nr:hypothetical protein Y1Q_0024463 [Alligator mississippiensis]
MPNTPRCRFHNTFRTIPTARRAGRKSTQSLNRLWYSSINPGNISLFWKNPRAVPGKAKAESGARRTREKSELECDRPIPTKWGRPLLPCIAPGPNHQP